MKLRAALLVACILACVLLTVDGAKKRKAKRPSTPTGFRQITDANAPKELLETPRAHGYFVLFTTRDASIRCGLCGPVEDRFKSFASTYRRWKKMTNPSTDVRLGVALLEDARQTMSRFELYEIPVLLYFPPQKRGQVTAARATKFPLPHSHPSNEHFAAFLKQVAGLDVVAIPAAEERMPLLVAGTLAIALLGGLIVYHPSLLLGLPRNRHLWRFVSMLVYGASVGGMVFCLIRTPEMFSYRGDASKWKDKYSFISWNGHEYVLEGVLVGLLLLGFAAGAIGVIKAGKSGGNWGNANVRSLVILGCAGWSFVAFNMLLSTYSQKTPWYSAKMVFDLWLDRLV